MQGTHKELSEDLFIALLPSKLTTLFILRLVDGILSCFDRSDKFKEILHQLMQRLDFMHHQNMLIQLRNHSHCLLIDIMLYKNGTWILRDIENLFLSNCFPIRRCYPIDALFLFSLMISELQFFRMISAPSNLVSLYVFDTAKLNLAYLQTVEDLWRTLCQQHNVHSLLRLCILCTRNSMSSLDDKSFLGLPIPPYIRKLLTYRDVSEKIFDEFCKTVRRYERPLSHYLH